MAKLLTVCAIVATIVFIGGCSTSYVNQPTSPLQVITKAQLAPDIEIGDKIEGQATVYRIMWFFVCGPGKFAEGVNYGSNLPAESVSDNTITEAKAAAAYRACVENKADFIICPRYYVITNNYFFVRATTAKVFGYKGVLNGVDKILPPESKAPSVLPIELTQPVQMEIDKPLKVDVQTTSKPKARTATPLKKPDSSLK